MVKSAKSAVMQPKYRSKVEKDKKKYDRKKINKTFDQLVFWG